VKSPRGKEKQKNQTKENKQQKVAPQSIRLLELQVQRVQCSSHAHGETISGRNATQRHGQQRLRSGAARSVPFALRLRLGAAIHLQ